MRRRVIKQGNNSYTVTLPVKWIKDEHIQPGTEVDIEQEDKHLIISLPRNLKKPESRIELDLSGYDKRTIKAVIRQAYRKGYDQMLLRFKDKKELDIIKHSVRTTILGFEVVNEKTNTCVIQNIAEPSGEKFGVILRKLFLLIKTAGEDILEDFKLKKLNNLEQRKEIKNMVDTYTNYCRRVVIKDKIGGTKNSYMLFLIISRLSLIHHAYYYMYKFAAKQKNFSVSRECLKLLAETNQLYTMFYEAFYEKDMNKANEVTARQNILFYDHVRNLLQKKTKAEGVILYHASEILRLIQMQASTIFGLTDLEKMG